MGIVESLKLTQSQFSFLVILGITANAVGLFTGVMMIDGALYALIAKNMVISGDYTFLTLHGFDWLDKPHFQFWCTALSYHIFGINSFAYKLPAFIFWSIGLRYTYLLADNLYNTHVARVAVLIYLSALHLVLCNSAVNAEPYLTGMAIAAVYYFYQAYRQNTFRYYFWGACWAAMAVMTKGIFVLIIVGSGFVVLWLARREWKQFINWRWYAAIGMILIFILPELYCLYLQFDARPQVEVFGMTNISGIRFFFWDSQFGRFFNSGPIKGSGDPLFYLHTILWAFLPWSLLWVFALFFSFCRRIWSVGHPLIWGAVLLVLIMFSASRFQLPHYLNTLFPMLSIWVARFLSFTNRLPNFQTIYRAQWLLTFVLISVMCILTVIFRSNGWVAMAVVASLTGIGGLLAYWRAAENNLIYLSYGLGLMISIFYGAYLYPGLLRFQSGDQMGSYINQHLNEVPGNRLLVLDKEIDNFTLGFRSKIPLFAIRNEAQWSAVQDGDLLAIKEAALESIPSRFDVDIVASFAGFRVSRITSEFFNHRSRETQLSNFLLVRLKYRG